MQLAFRFLKQVHDENSFIETTSYTISQGNAGDLYFRLVDLDQKCQMESPLRYLPSLSASMEVQFTHIDSTKSISRVATMAFPDDDRSIWKVPVLSTDHFQANSLTVILTDGGVTRTLLADGELRSSRNDNGRYFC